MEYKLCYRSLVFVWFDDLQFDYDASASSVSIVSSNRVIGMCFDFLLQIRRYSVENCFVRRDVEFSGAIKSSDVDAYRK